MKPILFNTEMVRAILDGRKTCTRRGIKVRLLDNECGWRIITNARTGEFVRIETYDEWEEERRWIRPPYLPGDILYVRETWKRVCASEHCYEHGECVSTEELYGYRYRADNTDAWDERKPRNNEFFFSAITEEMNWRPSIHMPKEAARIFLRVTDVRVERLQDMTEDDAFKEGFNGIPWCSHPVFENYPDTPIPCDASDGSECPPDRPCDRSIPQLFGEMIWDSTIKPADRDIYGWAANPWVWVIEFERISREEAIENG